MTKTFMNLTPHTVNIIDGTEAVVASFDPTGTVARVSSTVEAVGAEGLVPLHKVTFGDVEGLPNPQKDVLYIVSGLIKSVVDRDDLVSPSELVRDDKGRVVGCRGLAF